MPNKTRELRLSSLSMTGCIGRIVVGNSILVMKTQLSARESVEKQKANPKIGFLLVTIGRGGGIRTRDPLHPMQVRYQAALRPDKRAIIYECA